MNEAEQTLAGRLPVTWQMAAVKWLAAPTTSLAMGEDGSCMAEAIWLHVLPAIAAGVNRTAAMHLLPMSING